ncbi:zinc-binding dehydrogenase [Actinomadura miaoliensis]|uniref:Zinc-binding dehydrogenase n=1 Tax=Actinomadura miaoliensis TaxID=430685 RepID=A0ABP7VGI3_9ACTN
MFVFLIVTTMLAIRQAEWDGDMGQRVVVVGAAGGVGHLAGLEALAGLVRAGSLKVHVDRTFPLEDAAEAHRLVARGRTTGKVVLTVEEELR